MAAPYIMYPPQKDSPSTFMIGDISNTDVFIVVANAAVLPQTMPYPLTIGFDKKNPTETVIVTNQDIESGQLTVTRGTPAYAWLAGTGVARVLTAQDVSAIQDNITSVDSTATSALEESNENASDISALEETVGDADSGLVKQLADEIDRSTLADETEIERATTEEERLDAVKISRTELTQVITDWVYEPSATAFLLEITRYNSSDQTTTTYMKEFPIADEENIGLITPEAYAEIISLRSDVTALQNQGGKFIGVSFATKAALETYTVPSTVNVGDFTYVLDDEAHSDATTRWIFDGDLISSGDDFTTNGFAFAYVINYDPVGLATATDAGLVKSSSGVNGKVLVETDGTMSVVGWTALNSAVSGLSTTKANSVTIPNNNVLVGTGTTPGTYKDSGIPSTQIIQYAAGRIPQTNIVAFLQANALGWVDGTYTFSNAAITATSVISWSLSIARSPSYATYFAVMKLFAKASFAMTSQAAGSCTFTWDPSFAWVGGGTCPLDVYIWGS